MADVSNQNKQAQFQKGEDLGITVKREENFSEWFIQVLTKAELIDYTDISGCYVFRPNSYALWESIQRQFDDMIKKDGVKNAYFPCFVSERALKAEADNFEGFCPEVPARFPLTVITPSGSLGDKIWKHPTRKSNRPQTNQ